MPSSILIPLFKHRLSFFLFDIEINRVIQAKEGSRTQIGLSKEIHMYYVLDHPVPTTFELVSLYVNKFDLMTLSTPLPGYTFFLELFLGNKSISTN